MSRESVEVVRRVYAEFERGRFASPEVLERLDPDVRITWLEAVAVRTETVGIREAGAQMRAWVESFERVTLNLERIAGAGDRVATVAVWRGRGRASAVATEWRVGTVWTVRDGKVVSMIAYEDPAEALRAVGLAE